MGRPEHRSGRSSGTNTPVPPTKYLLEQVVRVNKVSVRMSDIRIQNVMQKMDKLI